MFGVLALAFVGLVACGTDGPTPPPRNDLPNPGRPTLSPTYVPSGHAAAGDVFVHLFEWPWADVAVECEAVLGPAGYRAAQVSPPQEHAVLASQGWPWWQRYQPVSYSIDRSRSGTGWDFIDMLRRCDAVGIDIYVDAVINHMTAGSGAGSNGTPYTKYRYPGLYEPHDFHRACLVDDYQDEATIQDCELLGLADLHTGLAAVRERIADYLGELVRQGVAGFRIDAAKHIQPVELDSILDRVNERVSGDGLRLPYWFAEVIDHGGEAVEARDYFGLAYGTGGTADITEFRFRGVGDKFLGSGGQSLVQLDPDGPPGSRFSPAAWNLMPADKAVVFIENHDTQRDAGVSYREADAYRLANVWMLAQPYGYPKVMSGYAFDRTNQVGRDRGPPSGSDGATLPVRCSESLETAVIGEWVCEHRDPAIAAMVRFRAVVAGTPLERWWDNGDNAIAFSRGDRGFVVISRESVPVTATITTGLEPGAYCDAISGGRAPDGGCVGAEVTVGGAGQVQLELEPNSAVVLHVEARP